MSRKPVLLLTCEHASARVPRFLARHFVGQAALLASHRGHDAGAAELARYLARRLGAPLLEGRTTRLAVDLNRSSDHPHLLGPSLRNLPRNERQAARDRLLAELWEPFRAAAEAEVHDRVEAGAFVLHLSVHSMTPVLAGRRRDMDLAVLFDPQREPECALARHFADSLHRQTGLVVARNRPYRGTSDGHTTSLRGQFSARLYAGVELELNQALLRAGRVPPKLAASIVVALRETLDQTKSAPPRNR